MVHVALNRWKSADNPKWSGEPCQPQIRKVIMAVLQPGIWKMVLVEIAECNVRIYFASESDTSFLCGEVESLCLRTEPFGHPPTTVDTIRK